MTNRIDGRTAVITRPSTRMDTAKPTNHTTATATNVSNPSYPAATTTPTTTNFKNLYCLRMLNGEYGIRRETV